MTTIPRRRVLTCTGSSGRSPAPRSNELTVGWTDDGCLWPARRPTSGTQPAMRRPRGRRGFWKDDVAPAARQETLNRDSENAPAAHVPRAVGGGSGHASEHGTAWETVVREVAHGSKLESPRDDQPAGIGCRDGPRVADEDRSVRVPMPTFGQELDELGPQVTQLHGQGCVLLLPAGAHADFRFVHHGEPALEALQHASTQKPPSRFLQGRPSLILQSEHDNTGVCTHGVIQNVPKIRVERQQNPVFLPRCPEHLAILRTAKSLLNDGGDVVTMAL